MKISPTSLVSQCSVVVVGVLMLFGGSAFKVDSLVLDALPKKCGGYYFKENYGIWCKNSSGGLIAILRNSRLHFCLHKKYSRYNN